MGGGSTAAGHEEGKGVVLPAPDPLTLLPLPDPPTELPPADPPTVPPPVDPPTDLPTDVAVDRPADARPTRRPAGPSVVPRARQAVDPHHDPGGRLPARARRGRRPDQAGRPYSSAALAARPVGGRVTRGLGEIMITAGVVVVLFLVYQLWITDILAARTQSDLRRDLTTAWAHRPPPPAPTGETGPPRAVPPVDLGEGLAVLRVPRFGADYAPVIVEGVSADALRRGPGHFPGTAMPGEVGNFVVSGHRTTYGKPFGRVDELRVGDPIVVEVADRYFTYRVTRSEVVDPHRLDVTYPVPEHPGIAPTSAIMTLTTCHPRFSARSRLIVFAELDQTTDRADGPPPALADE
ncbi:class E sortase [Parafrankia sp. BMG5.11]|uniref:class E sortase n=1 Tax=Parafrankia sp. BMG5.11 TaxID=222540 RepID=UPI001038F4D4|nr:class E sortase [Parafrankia sp. BMG5.11]TCJ40128.1 class E sortase [Parafrankia sp. BMG5.11]